MKFIKERMLMFMNSFIYEVVNKNIVIHGINDMNKDILIPSSIIGYKVTSIGDKAFISCKHLESVRMSDDITTIGESAFCFCDNLSFIKLPSELTEIKDYAFNGCSKLQSIKIPNGVKRIGKWAFANCSSLKSILIPSSVTFIGVHALPKDVKIYRT